MKVKFLSHIAVQVKDYPTAIDFYCNYLGMKLLKRGKSEAKLQLGEMTFYVEDNDAGKVFFAFEVDSLLEMRSRLERAGCRVTAEHEEGVMFSDPYGLNYFVSETKTRKTTDN